MNADVSLVWGSDYVADLGTLMNAGEVCSREVYCMRAEVVYAQVCRQMRLSQLRVKDAMTSHPTVIAESVSLPEAIRRMSDAGARRVPVVNEAGDLVGIITLDDLLPIVSEELQGLARLIGGQARAARAR
jgi:CBS-domain-containing membrane protein